MSFIDNVLGSIGGPKQPSAPRPRTQLPTGLPGVPSAQKRKAEDVLNKDVKRERSSGTASSPAVAKTETSSTTPLPYRGTARPQSAVPASKVATKPSVATRTAPSKPSITTTVVSKASANPAKGPTTPTLPTPAFTAPKKGFAALLARGQAAQQIAGTTSVTTIKHKPVEKLSRKERLAKEEEARKAAAKAAVTTKGKPPPHGTKAAAPLKPGEKPKREPVDLGYKGTARAVPEPTYKGTAHLVTSRPSSVKPGAGRGAPRPGVDRSRSSSAALPAARRGVEAKRRGYASYSEPDEEEDDYASDVSSDMEAGFDDVEYEERAALRQAVIDDKREQEIENSLKSEKERRKAALQRLAADRAARSKK